MAQRRNIKIGDTFGSWTVMGQKVSGLWPCQCACGRTQMMQTRYFARSKHCNTCRGNAVRARNAAKRSFVPTDPDSPKTCTKCKTPKRRRDFGRGRQWGDGLHPWCRTCVSEAQAARNAAMTHEERAAARLAHREKRDANADARSRYLTNQQLYSLKRRYGITVQDLLALVEKQGGACAICRCNPEPGKRRGLVVDHDHETGKVRGLLCNKCNLGLGGFCDNIENLMAAITYLIDNQSIDVAAQ